MLIEVGAFPHLRVIHRFCHFLKVSHNDCLIKPCRAKQEQRTMQGLAEDAD